MKIGFNMLLWTAHVAEPHFPLFRTLKQVGYDGVEIPIFDVTRPAHFERIGRALEAEGLECTAATTLPDEAHSAISLDPRDRQGAIDYLQRVIECAHGAGARTLCGPIYQALGRFTGRYPTEDELNFACDVHRAIAPAAQAANVTIAIEAVNRFEAHLLNTMAQLASYVTRVDHPSIGAMYDTFHANLEEQDLLAAVEIVSQTGKLHHVHISENDRGTPGRGHIDFRATIARLIALEYDGWLTIEAFGGALPDLAAATRVWRDYFPSPQQVYEEGYALIRECCGPRVEAVERYTRRPSSAV